MARTGIGASEVEVYRRPARVLHWLTVALLLVQVPVGVYMAYRGGTLNLWDGLTNTMYSAHKLVGLTILAIVLARLGYRLVRGAPKEEPTIEPWQRIAARANHWGLYLLLIAVPIAGWIGVSKFPALGLFGPVSLPAIAAPDKEGATAVFAIHGALALALVALAAVHVAAALYHHLIRKDRVLARMWPSLMRR